MKKFIRIGVDLAKNYFQVHALESENGRAVTRKLKRSKMHEFFSKSSPASLAWRPAARRIIGGVTPITIGATRVYYVQEMLAALILFSALFASVAAIVLILFLIWLLLDRASQWHGTYGGSGEEHRPRSLAPFARPLRG